MFRHDIISLDSSRNINEIRVHCVLALDRSNPRRPDARQHPPPARIEQHAPALLIFRIVLSSPAWINSRPRSSKVEKTLHRSSCRYIMTTRIYVGNLDPRATEQEVDDAVRNAALLPSPLVYSTMLQQGAMTTAHSCGAWVAYLTLLLHCKRQLFVAKPILEAILPLSSLTCKDPVSLICFRY